MYLLYTTSFFICCFQVNYNSFPILEQQPIFYNYLRGLYTCRIISIIFFSGARNTNMSTLLHVCDLHIQKSFKEKKMVDYFIVWPADSIELFATSFIK